MIRLTTAMLALLVGFSTCAEPNEGTSPKTFAEWARALKGVGGSPKWATGKLGGFAADYQSRIVANPNDYEARLLHAATLMAALGENETLTEYLKTFGFEINYLGLKLSGEESNPSTWPDANGLIDAAVVQCAPVLQTALDDLKAIPVGWTGKVHLDSATWPLDEDVYVDVADVLYARAGIESMLGTLYFLKGYDLTVDWVKARSLDKQKIPVLESAPSLDGDDGWDGALTLSSMNYEDSSAGPAIQIAFAGGNLYVRINSKDGFDVEDSLDSIWMYVMVGPREVSMEYSSWSGVFTVNNGLVPYPEWTDGMEWEDWNELYSLYMENNRPCPMHINRSTSDSIVIWVEVSEADIGDDIGKMALDDIDITLRRPNMAHYQWGWPNDYYSYMGDGKLSMVTMFQREQTNFLSNVRGLSSLAVSKEWMRSALTDSLSAYIAMTNRIDDGKYRFVEYDPVLSNEFDVARMITEKALAALEAPVTINCAETFGKYNPDKDYTLLPNNGVMQVYLGALFSGSFNRDFIPTFGIDKYGTLEPVGTIHDATLGGALPLMTSSQWIETLGNFGIAHGLESEEPVPIFTIENGVLTAVDLNGATMVTIPDGVTGIGARAFADCSGLTRVTIPDSVISVGNEAFSNCDESLYDTTSIPGVVLVDGWVIGYDYDATYGATLDLAGVRGIGDSAFSFCLMTGVTIPDSVASIGSRAFFWSGLSSVDIPSSVVRIGDGAFAGCFSLRSIEVSADNGWYKSIDGLLLSTDGKSLVAVPSGLASVTIPEDVANIGDMAFAWCVGLTNIIFNGNAPVVSSTAFIGVLDGGFVVSADCVVRVRRSSTGWGVEIPGTWNGMRIEYLEEGPQPIFTIKDGILIAVELNGATEVVIPNSVMSIGQEAFADCSSLTSVTIPDSVTSIGVFAFYRCSGLTNVTIPSSVTNIGFAAFFDCCGLADESGFYIVGDMLCGYYGADEDIATPDGVTSIGDGAFYCCPARSITISDCVTNIWAGAFVRCAVTNLIFEGDAPSFNDYDFGVGEDCVVRVRRSSTGWGVEIPGTWNGMRIEYLEDEVVPVAWPGEGTLPEDCSAYDDGTYTWVWRQESGGGAVLTGYYSDFTDPVYGFQGSSDFCGVYPDPIGEVSIPSFIPAGTVGRVWTGSEYVYKALLEDVPVVGMDEGLFVDCSEMTRVVIPAGVTNVHAWAFDYCGGLLGVDVADGNPCYKSENGFLLTKDGERLVQGINGDVAVPNGVTVIGDSAFYGCSGLESVTIPDSVTLIEEDVFGWCSSLTSVTIPDSVTSIGDGAFSGCDGLTSVTIPDSVTSIGERAFNRCSGLMNISVGAGNTVYTSARGMLLTKDGKTLLVGVNGDVTIPNGVTSIGAWAFYGREGLTSVTIPDSVTSIGEYAFEFCDGLTRVTFLGNAPTVDSFAFPSAYDLSCVASVSPKSTGWGVEIPGTWNRMRIEYIETDGADLAVVDGVGVSSTSFMPGDTVTVQYVEMNVGTTNAVAPWYDRVMLEGANGTRGNLKTLDSAAWGQAALPIGAVITNTVECVIPDLVPLAGDVRFVVAADVNDDVEEINEANNDGKSEVVSLGKKLYLTAASASVKENVSGGVRFTVKRSGPVNEALTLNVSTTGGASSSPTVTVNGQDARSPSGVAVTIPAGSVSTIFTVTPIDNTIVDGTRVVSVSVSADGFTGTFVPLTILDDEVPRLTVTLDKTTIREGDGVITATVTREGSTDGDLTVYLTWTSERRVSCPSSVVIPSGSASVTFEISVPNNDVAQVASELTLRASSSGYQSAAVTYTVEDDDVPGVVLTIAPAEVQEGAGASAAVMTLARADTEDMSKAITVRLTASAANVLIMPKEVVIPANNHYVRQEIGVVDNANVEPNRDITITGAIVIPSCNCSAQPSSGGEIQTMLRIIDDDSLALKLRVEPLMMKEGQEVAGYITVGQNTVLAENLVVSLYSDNNAEIELPSTVVIPAGETSVRVPVKTLNDGVEDGTVQVNIYAKADGYAPDSKWVFVTDQNLPDLMPVDVMPQYATTTSGERFPVHFAVTNIGYLTSKRSVPFSIYCVRGKSATVEGAGMLVFSGMTDGAVDISESVTVSAIVTVPDITGDCRFAVVVDPDRLITELNDANNTAYSPVVSVSPSYMAEAQVECERFLQGSTIEISGVAVKSDGTTPAANVEVEVYIIRDEFRRSLTVTTDAQGRFAATFKPTTSEAGHYVVGASFPGMNATAEQDAFDILGMKRTGDAYLEYNNIPLGDEMSKTVYIRNMSPIDLTGVSAEVVGVLSGCEIETSFTDVLSGGATTPLTLTLRGTDLTSGRDYKEFTLRLTSAEGATLDIPVLYFVQYQQAHLKAAPASIDTTMTVGQTRYVDFTIYNDGRGDSGKVTILTSPFSWLSVEGGNEISNIASNESAIVTLKLTPGDDVELNNRYTGEIAAVCESQHGKVCVVPFAFKAVSEHTGTLKVDVIDGYTYYLPDAPHVSNATVRISNKYTGEIVASGTTGVDGTWTSGEIGEGKWQLAIVANGRKPYYNEVTISPGVETVLPPIYLEAQTVTLSYSVTPTNIVDTYIVTLVTEYETSVPEPVLVTTFDGRIPNLQEGDQFAFNAIVVNKGLVAVHGVYLEMPTIDGWEFAVGDSGFSLAPEESAVVPIIVRRPRKRMALMATAAAVTVTKVDCVDVVRTRGYWYCGGDRHWHEYKVQLPTERVCTTTTYTIVPTEEESKPPTKPGRTGGGGGTYTPGGGGSGTSRITISKTDCEPCLNSLDDVFRTCGIADDKLGSYKKLYELSLNMSVVDKRFLYAQGVTSVPWSGLGNRFGALSIQNRNDCIALAKIARDVYKREPYPLPDGFSMLSEDDIKKYIGGGFHIDNDGIIQSDTIDSLQAGLYKRNDDGLIILAFRGSEGSLVDALMLDNWDSVEDWIATNPYQIFCAPTTQYENAQKLLRQILSLNEGKSVVVVGHSLGGGLAQHAMLGCGDVARVSGVTFNSAGLCPLNRKLWFANDSTTVLSGKVINIRDDGDPVSFIGRHIGPIYSVENARTGFEPHKISPLIEDMEVESAFAKGNDWKYRKQIFLSVLEWLKGSEYSKPDIINCLRNLEVCPVTQPMMNIDEIADAVIAGTYEPVAHATGNAAIDEALKDIEVLTVATEALSGIMDEVVCHMPWGTKPADEILDLLNQVRNAAADSEEILASSLTRPQSVTEDEFTVFVQSWNKMLSDGAKDDFSKADDKIDLERIDKMLRIIVHSHNYFKKKKPNPPSGGDGDEDDDDFNIGELIQDIITRINDQLGKSSGSVCAKVTLELSQEVTMTREAFIGTLSVSNGHTSKPITDMKMEVEITDENGDRCEDRLFQSENAGLVTMQGTSILDGGVSLAANSSGSANILFTPSTEAAKTVPKVYYFGGTVTYTDPFVGETVRVKLQPAVPVTVHPSPELTFHYFLQRDVMGDDPFTKDVVEESEPAEVALLILNKGYGDAENVTIKTAEPTITENEKELKVDFNWVGAALDGSSTRLGYRNVDIGTVPAQGSRLAQWWLTSSLQGHFTKVDGSYTRLNSNGNPDFDLVKDVRTHTLVRSITADSDALPDFLVTERRFDGKPDKIYTAKGEPMDVAVASDASLSGNSVTATLTVTPGATGWNYASCKHSFGDGLTISRVTRGDGSEVPLRNVWLTNRTFEDGVDPIVEDRIHIADEMAYGITSAYTVEFGGAAGAVDRPQVVGFFGVAGQMAGNPAAIEVQFSCDIDATTFDVSDLTLHHQGTAVADLSGLSISASGESGRFAISGLGTFGLGSGTYVLTVQASGVKDLSGISGTGSKSVMWTVVGDSTPPAQVADLAISPDGGYSDTDGITYTGALTVSGTLPEAGLTVEIIAKYVSGDETVLATFDGEGGSFSQNINLPGSGNVTLVVRLTDAAGNSSDTEKNVFVDGIALTGELRRVEDNAPYQDDDSVVVTAATLTFSAEVMDGDVTLEKFSLSRDGKAVALEGVTLRRVGDNAPYQWELSGLDALCAEDGQYVLRFDGSAVRKYSSGLLMGGSLVMRWRYENPDREPPTVTEVLFDGESPHEAYTNVFSTVAVTFSEAVNVPELIEKGLIGRAARIDLLDVAGVVTGCVAAVRRDGVIAPYQWDAESNTLSWQIDPLSVPAGSARLMLDAGIIEDMAGNRLSDGRRVEDNAPYQGEDDGRAAYPYAAVSNGMRTYALSETVLASVNAQAMPTWYNGELYVGEKTADNKGKIRHYAANGTWTYLQSEGVDIEVPAQGCQGASVAFADMDGDGFVETYVGTATGDVLKYPGGETIVSLGVNRAMPYGYDIDGDGCDELITGGMDGRIRIIQRRVEDNAPYQGGAQSSVTETYFVTHLADVNGAPLTVPNGRAASVVADINHDGLADIVSGDTAGNVWAYLGMEMRRVADNAPYQFAPQPICVFTNNVSLADRSRLGYGDVDGDGIEDLIVGRSDGSVTVMLGAETPSPYVAFAVLPLPLEIALNGDKLAWTTGGAAEWVGKWSREAADSLHEARCGAIPNGTNAWLSTTVEGAGTLTFKWRSTLASRNTKYQFMVDGEVKGMLTGTNGWTEATVSVFGDHAHEIKWRLVTGRSGAAGGDWVALDEVVWTPTVPPTLAEALNTNLVWTTDGDVVWRGVARESLTDARDAWAIVSGLGDNGTAAVQTRVYGSGILSFDWAVSCEEDYDWMELTVDGEVRDYVSGGVDWTRSAVEIVGDGWHVVRWEYIKDELDDPDLVGENVAKLDNVMWVSDDVEPTDPIPPVAAEAGSETVNATVDGVGFADAGVKVAIGGSATEYGKFKDWAQSVKGAGSASGAAAGEAAVVANTNAAAAYLLGAERLFENAPNIEFGEVNVANGDGGGALGVTRPTMTVSVTVLDGDETVKCAAEKVKEMFEATSDLGDWDGAAKLAPDVTVEGSDGATMRFKVTPGDGTSDRAFLRVKVK